LSYKWHKTNQAYELKFTMSPSFANNYPMIVWVHNIRLNKQSNGKLTKVNVFF
jgi:hypothetical protein